jgi:signal transduction histidine kinase
VQRLATLVRAYGLDALIVFLAAISIVRIWVEPITPRGSTSVLALLATLPLLARRRYPLAAPLAALVGLLALSFLHSGAAWEQLQLFLGALVAFWVIGSENTRRRAVIGLAVGLGVAVATVATDKGSRGVSDFVFGIAITTAAWLGGLVLGSHARAVSEAERRAERLAVEHEQQAREAVAEERARIARELHDVVAHTVSVMVVQAGAAEQVLDGENEAARAALASIRESGKGALLELRRLLLFIREDAEQELEPQPSLDRLDELVGRVEAAGVQVDVSQVGVRRPLPPGLDQAAYRIVQEALTNTIKHAGRPAHASVSIGWQPDTLLISVSDDGAGGDAVDGAAGGHGLIGMRERAGLYGGELEAGPVRDGGFAVRARLPL